MQRLVDKLTQIKLISQFHRSQSQQERHKLTKRERAGCIRVEPSMHTKAESRQGFSSGKR